MVDWARAIVRVISIGFAAFVGLILGAIILQLITGVIYGMIWPGPVTNSYECARSMFWGYMSILVGGLLGAFFSGYIAYKMFDDKPEEYKGPVDPRENWM